MSHSDMTPYDGLVNWARTRGSRLVAMADALEELVGLNNTLRAEIAALRAEIERVGGDLPP